MRMNGLMIGRNWWWVQRIAATLHSDDGMELKDEAATADISLGFPAGRDMGSMAARRVDELDRSRL
jgi:hypothetical protein